MSPAPAALTAPLVEPPPGSDPARVIDAAERVTGKKVPVKYGERRSGEPAVLIASSDPITRELGWKPQLQSLDEIIASAWRRRQHRKR